MIWRLSCASLFDLIWTFKAHYAIIIGYAKAFLSRKRARLCPKFGVITLSVSIYRHLRRTYISVWLGFRQAESQRERNFFSTFTGRNRFFSDMVQKLFMWIPKWKESTRATMIRYLGIVKRKPALVQNVSLLLTSVHCVHHFYKRCPQGWRFLAPCMRVNTKATLNCIQNSLRFNLINIFSQTFWMK